MTTSTDGRTGHVFAQGTRVMLVVYLHKERMITVLESHDIGMYWHDDCIRALDHRVVLVT
jgi:hypothetical protein